MFRKYCHVATISGSAFEPGLKSFRMAVELIASGAIDVTPLPTHRFPFERLTEAYELARSREDGAIKVVVQMPAYHEGYRL